MTKEEFWSKQYKSHIGKMVGVCYRYVGDWQVAEDLAQDAFLKAMGKGSSYHAWGSFEGWLKKIAVNEALMYLRDRPETMALDEGMAVEEPMADEPQEVKVDFSQEELLEFIRNLPVKQRTVFNLYAVEHWSHKQIAQKLDISVANSKVLLSRARAELQGMLAAMRVKKLRN
jgi:RNA polymerase sigma-70 factor (ECF subfamily)